MLGLYRPRKRPFHSRRKLSCLPRSRQSKGYLMGQDLTLTSSDGFKLGAYRADPKGTPKGAIVVIQEIFGVNHHIRAVTDRLADEGYVAIAPAVFDRMEKNFQTGYTPDDIAK